MFPRGIDSSGENLKGADFARVKAAGYVEVALRACVGTWQDPYYALAAAKVKQAGLLRGAYMFLRWDVAAQPQVDVFSRIIGEPERGAVDVVPCVDVEFPGGGRAKTGPSAEKARDILLDAVDAFVARFGCWPEVYSSGRVLHEDLLDLLAPCERLKDCPFWDARYLYADRHEPMPAVAWEPPIPAPWGAGNFWGHQYQGNAVGVPGILGLADVNRYKLMLPGETGLRVQWVQRRVFDALPPDDAAYGTATQAAVCSYQRKRGLADDGVVGPATFAYLGWERPRF